MVPSRLCLALSLILASSALAGPGLGLSEPPRKAGVGLPLNLQGLRAPAPEVQEYAGGTRTYYHSYRVLYGGKTLEAGKWTLVLHLVHRIEMIFQPKDPVRQVQIAVDNEITSYHFVHPEEVSIGGAHLQVLTFDDSNIEFVEN